jgi:hypothetical protein
MAITVSNATIESAREYEKQQQHLKETPKLYRFTYFDGNDVFRTSILAPNEHEAQLLFDLLAAESGRQMRIENQEFCGVCDFMTPNLAKAYNKKLSMGVYDKFYAVLKLEKENQEKHAQAEEEKRRAKIEKTKEQKRNHALDVLVNAAQYAKRLGLWKEQRDKEQSEDFSKWMKMQ